MSAPVVTAGRAPGPVERAAPFLFLLFWSGGYVAARIGVGHAEPLTFVALRFVLAAAIFAAVAALRRERLPASRYLLGHLAMTGVLSQGIYFAGCYLGFAQGVSSATVALINGLQPILVAIVAAPLLGERITAVKVVGLGLGIAGVLLVLQVKLGEGVGTAAGVLWVAIATVSITSGTLYQKRFCPQFALWSGGAVQYASALVVVLPAALLTERQAIAWSPDFTLALVYVVVVNSVLAVTLMNLMIRTGEASKVSSLYFLVPGGAALLAWLILGETLAPLALLGLAVASLGVLVVMRPVLVQGRWR
jgi:drug/metabolite transporter (DMT)-like permease